MMDILVYTFRCGKGSSSSDIRRADVCSVWRDATDSALDHSSTGTVYQKYVITFKKGHFFDHSSTGAVY